MYVCTTIRNTNLWALECVRSCFARKVFLVHWRQARKCLSETWPSWGIEQGVRRRIRYVCMYVYHSAHKPECKAMETHSISLSLTYAHSYIQIHTYIHTYIQNDIRIMWYIYNIYLLGAQTSSRRSYLWTCRSCISPEILLLEYPRYCDLPTSSCESDGDAPPGMVVCMHVCMYVCMYVYIYKVLTKMFKTMESR